jgi:predicted RNA binding protein YcfA (HicA-like mRNA interferase family)
MKLPRNISGEELAGLLVKYGYARTRQAGSHIRLTSGLKGVDHHVTIPRHDHLKVGTLNSVLTSVAEYLKREKKDIIEELFK